MGLDPLGAGEDAFAECSDGADPRAEKIRGMDPLGAYLEFGVSRGTSLAAMHHALERAGLPRRVRSFGFDSFQGLPPEAQQQGWPPGAVSVDHLRHAQVPPDEGRASRIASDVIEGWFEDTLTQDTACQARPHQGRV